MFELHNGDNHTYSYFKPPKTFVKSAIRVINVLDFFYRERKPARVSDISRELELPISSAKYLLSSLVESGYLNFESSDKTYFPSILLSGFSSWLSDVYPNVEHLRVMAETAFNAHGLVSAVMVLHDHSMRPLYVESDSEKRAPVYDYRARVPLTRSASGLAALSSRSQEYIDALLRVEERKWDPESRKREMADVWSRLAFAQNHGYSIVSHSQLDQQRPSEGLAVAIPIDLGSQFPPLALSLCGSRSAMENNIDGLVASMQTIVQGKQAL